MAQRIGLFLNLPFHVFILCLKYSLFFSCRILFYERSSISLSFSLRDWFVILKSNPKKVEVANYILKKII